MDAKFKSLLPENVRSLVDEIETFSETEISVTQDTTPPSPTLVGGHSISTTVNETEAVIFYHEEAHLIPYALLHELLHIHRYWVEMVPQLLPCRNGNRVKITSQIENVLEHLIIVPKVAEYGFEPYSHWNDLALKVWQRYPWPEIPEGWPRRKNCLLHWLEVTSIVNDARAIQLAEEALREESLLEEAKKFEKKIKSVLFAKPLAISAAVRFLKIPREEVVQVYYDVRNREMLSREVLTY